MNLLRRYFYLDNRLIIGFLLLVELIYQLILRSKVYTDEVFFNSLIGYYSAEDIQQGVETQKNLLWIYLLLSLCLVLVQIFIIALCLNIGNLLLRLNIPFGRLFGIVSKAFIAFAAGKAVLLALASRRDIRSFEDLFFIPRLSLYDLFPSAGNVSEALIYPMQMINLFQVGFVFLIAAGLFLHESGTLGRWIRFTVSVYVPALAVWMSIMVFLFFLNE